MNDELDPNSSIAYIALSLLCSRQSSLIPELLYILSPQQITTFIKVFSGETLRIPTVDEFSRDLMASLAAYHIVVEGKSWDWFRLKYSLDGNYMNSVTNPALKYVTPAGFRCLRRYGDQTGFSQACPGDAGGVAPCRGGDGKGRQDAG